MNGRSARVVLVLALWVSGLFAVPAPADSGCLGDGSDRARPQVETALAVVSAGGGPGNFKTLTLLRDLAGPSAESEVATLTKIFGAAKVKQSIATFDFVIADAGRLGPQYHLTLPPAPGAGSKDGQELWAALCAAGADRTGAFNVDTLLDRLMSRPLHVRIMHDIDRRYGSEAEALYHGVMLQVMRDLKAQYANAA